MLLSSTEVSPSLMEHLPRETGTQPQAASRVPLPLCSHRVYEAGRDLQDHPVQPSTQHHKVNRKPCP